MTRISRRGLLAGAAATVAAGTASRLGARPSASRPDTIVVGAGVFGAWTAHFLREAGQKVLLVDAWGPAHARASSGGESRMTRGAYGADQVYTRMAHASLAEWKRLSDISGLPIFQQTGVLFFSPPGEAYFDATMEVHRSLRLPTERLSVAELRARFPQIDFDGIESGIWEPGFGALMARRAVQTLVGRFVEAGGEYRQAAIRTPTESDRLETLVTLDGEMLSAARFVFACGPWLGRLFPALLGPRIFPTRQEVFFFAPEPGDRRFGPDQLPGWADFNGGDIFYGFPDLEARGFKIAHDAHGPPMDPDTGDRTPSPSALANVRSYLERRFPALARRPLSEARVCQYENSSNGDLLIDLHPRWANVVLVGAGSGHGFKHGPAVGFYAAQLLLGRLDRAEPRFSLATKAEAQARNVH